MKLRRYDNIKEEEWGSFVSGIISDINESVDSYNAMIERFKSIQIDETLKDIYDDDKIIDYVWNMHPVWLILLDRISLIRTPLIFEAMPEDVDKWLTEIKEVALKEKVLYDKCCGK